MIERRKSTGSGLFALLSPEFEQMIELILSVRVKTLSSTNLVVSRHIKREKSTLPVLGASLKNAAALLSEMFTTESLLIFRGILSKFHFHANSSECQCIKTGCCRPKRKKLKRL